MSGLLDNLMTASNSLATHRLGLEVAGQNIANINTPGYSRRMLNLTELGATDPWNAGRGVSVVGIRALRDTLVEARLWREQSNTAMDFARAESLATIEAAVGLPGSSLDADLTALFDSFSDLASDPTSAAARDQVVGQGTRLATAFRTMVARLNETAQDANESARATVDEINTLTAEIAQLNVQIEAGGYNVDTLKDRQSVLVSRLSELADVAVQQREDGGVDVTLPSGRALVIGASAYALSASQTQNASFMLEGVDVTSELTGGRMGGLLNIRDTVVPGYLGQLDQMAYDLANAVNAVHATGFDANGAPAGMFFAPPAGVAGAASALAVDAALVADSSLVAASADGTIGNNVIAQQLADLRDADITGGGTRTVFEAFSQFLYGVGSDALGARAGEASHGQVVRQLQALRDQASGVNYDEEAAHLMRYQRAYEANARYFTTIVETLDTLMQMVR